MGSARALTAERLGLFKDVAESVRVKVRRRGASDCQSLWALYDVDALQANAASRREDIGPGERAIPAWHWPGAGWSTRTSWCAPRTRSASIFPAHTDGPQASRHASAWVMLRVRRASALATMAGSSAPCPVPAVSRARFGRR